MVHLFEGEVRGSRGIDAVGKGEVRMGEVRLREYRAGDLEAMWALDVACFAEAFRFSRRAMRGFAEARGAAAVVAEVSGGEGEGAGMVGFCVAQLEGEAGYVVTLDVAEAWRRRGLARRLMEEVEARMRAAGAVGMALHVSVENAAAIGFYAGMGYARVGRVKGFYGRGGDAWVYRREF
ncbi:MAG: N-acetyltransferase [Acidobacteriaceae bacterium]|jgi:ribosomal-protein-alanine N-acetyltransferase